MTPGWGPNPRGPGARRVLLALVPDDDWSREFVAELDGAFAEAREAGRARRPGLWYLRELLTPATLRLVWILRRRERARAAAARNAKGRSMATRSLSVPRGLAQDGRQALRSVLREPRATGSIVMTLALGIGSVSALHAVADRLFLRGPPHVHAPGELARLYLSFDEDPVPRTAPFIPYLTARAIQDEARAFAGVALYRSYESLARVGSAVAPARIVETDERYFDVLGVSPAAGTFFRGGEGGDGEALAVLAHGLAVAAFGSVDAALGRPIELGTAAYEVVAVAPAEFAGVHLERVDAWIPAGATPTNRNWWVVGRLRGGSGDPEALRRAAAEATAIHRSVDPGPSFRWALDGSITLAEASADDTGLPAAEVSVARLLLALAALLLIVGCVNAVNLLLVRLTRREGEVVVRVALGAGRWRLMSLLTWECLILAAAGGLLSVPVAYLGSLVFRRTLLPEVAWSTSSVDLGMLGVTAGLSLGTGLVLGLVTAVRGGRRRIAGALTSRHATATPTRARTHAALATAQVTLATALLVCAGLFLKSFWTIRVTDLGVDGEVLVVQLRSLDPAALPHGSEGESEIYARALEAVRGAEGAGSAALTVGVPFLMNFGLSMWVPGLDSIPTLPGGGPFVSAVGARYFETVGTAIVRGLPITEEHIRSGERVGVVSESMAGALWPGEDPLGRCVRVGAETAECHTVVGVAADVHRQGYREPPSVQFYVPFGQQTSFFGTALVVRPNRATAGARARVENALSGLDPRVDHVDVVRLDSLLEAQVRPWRLGAVVLTLTSLIAALVSVLGVYGVLLYLVAQRRQEIGVRMALGASGAAIRRLVVKVGAFSTGVGLAAGVLVVIAAAPWVGPLLFETEVADAAVIGTVGALITSAALIACLVPANQAARVDPASCLRAD